MPISASLQAFLDQLRAATTDGVSNILSDIQLFKAAISELSEGALEVQDEGIQVVAVATTMDFRGPGVVVTDVAGVARVTISGGAGGSVDFEEEGAAVVTSTTLNAVGGGVTMTDVAGVATITVPLPTIDFEEEGAAVVSASVFNAVGIGGTMSDVAGVATLTLPGIAYQEEGAGVVSAVILNFVGSPVTVTNVGGVATVTITGGATSWEEEGAAVVSSSTANFVGAGVTVTDVAGDATMTIPGELPTMLVVQQEANGTPGGASLASTQNLRDLNTIKKNTISGASLATKQITLPAGDYHASGFTCVAGSNLRVKTRLFDTTGAAALIIGASVIAAASNPSGYVSPFNGYFTLAVESVLELHTFTQNAVSTQGLGIESSSGDVEIFALIKIEKLD